MEYEVIEITEGSYAALTMSVKKYWEREKRPLIVVDSHIVSDRFTKRVYYCAIVRAGVEPLKEVREGGFWSWLIGR